MMRKFSEWHVAAVVCCCLLPAMIRAQDVVEFLNGAKVNGRVKEIRKPEQEFDFEVRIGERTVTRTYPFSKVQAVTMNGRRFVLNSAGTTGAAKDGTEPGVQPTERSQAEVLAQIEQLGKTPPDWFDDTPLDYPPTLDLRWPLKPPGGQWNSQKNMGQYIWDVINPNPGRWRAGVKLVHQCLALHRGQADLTRRDMQALGSMYFRFFQDYARAAFWLKKAGAAPGSRDGGMVAECYWRLGNRAMALDMLETRDFSGGGALQAIKLWGDMRETARVLQMVQRLAGTNVEAEANLLAGDALRVAGRHDQAIEYYQRVIRGGNHRNEDYERRFKGRAQDSIEAIRLFELADVSKVRDGTYRSQSIGYNGQIEVEVAVTGGKIDGVRVTRHNEKQFYSALTDTTAQILARQSVQGIDATSGATITSQAIVNATAKALATGSGENSR